MALTNANKAVALDAALANVTKTKWWKGNAGAETVATEVASTSTTLKAATAANPSVKSNNGAMESAAASASVTITAFTFDNAADNPQNTVVRLDTPVALLAGGKVSVVDGGLKEQLQHS